jgi:electron transfer flavoprotein alpha subunit
MSLDIFVLIEHLQGQVSDISYVMLAAARSLVDQAANSGKTGHVVALLLGYNNHEMALTLPADRVFYVDHPHLADFTPGAYQQVVGSLIEENAPRLLLCGDTSIGTEVAAALSIRHKLPLISYCRRVSANNGSINFVSQICGGKLLVEGTLPEPAAIVLMIPGGYKPDLHQTGQAPEVSVLAPPDIAKPAVMLRRYIEPEADDVDITRAPILVAVGRGVQNRDDLELAEELAAAIGGTVCASRPVVDQGWLSTNRLVGKSGKQVRPKLYLALGISGAPEHVEGITESELIIAVNSDPAAPIFNTAHFGIEADIFDLLPAIIEELEQVRGG